MFRRKGDLALGELLLGRQLQIIELGCRVLVKAKSSKELEKSSNLVTWSRANDQRLRLEFRVERMVSAWDESWRAERRQ